MTIEVVDPNEGIEDEDLFQEEDGEGTSYNMRELMDQVYQNNDIIFTVPTDQTELLKKGLIVRKGKDNQKLTKAGLKPDGLVLSFIVYPHKDNGKEVEGLSDIRVKLGPKKSVNIVKIHIPADEF